MDNRDWWTVQAMKQYGGTFVQCLAELAERADQNNLATIKRAWPKYWNEYEEIGKTLEAKGSTTFQ